REYGITSYDRGGYEIEVSAQLSWLVGLGVGAQGDLCYRSLRSWQAANSVNDWLSQRRPVRGKSAHQFWSGKSDGLTGKNSAELHRMKSSSAWRIISLESWRPGGSSG